MIIDKEKLYIIKAHPVDPYFLQNFNFIIRRLPNHISYHNIIDTFTDIYDIYMYKIEDEIVACLKLDNNYAFQLYNLLNDKMAVIVYNNKWYPMQIIYIDNQNNIYENIPYDIYLQNQNKKNNNELIHNQNYYNVLDSNENVKLKKIKKNKNNNKNINSNKINIIEDKNYYRNKYNIHPTILKVMIIYLLILIIIIFVY